MKKNGLFLLICVKFKLIITTRNQNCQMKKNLPTLVIALYNRIEPMFRLLDSLSRAIYPDSKINMVISIDNEKNNKNIHIKEAAEKFPWKFGEKEVIYHEKNLGIRDHFNFCGNLTEKYGSIVFLEDDLYVSEYYYDYVLQALEFYKNDNHVAGISLFNYNRIEQWENPLPFSALDDGYDNYFLQQASWGQIWTYEMWKPFQDWFKLNDKPDTINSFELPRTVKGWPATSWKKYYIAYMILKGKYYVFPRIALATNFDDVGIHRKSETVYYQSPLLTGKKRFQFSRFEQSMSIYDSYFEILPGIIKQFNTDLAEYNFAVNLYGSKEPENIKEDLVLSKQQGPKPVMSFNLVMKPHELNVIHKQSGTGIFLINKIDLNDSVNNDSFVADLVYFYRNMFTLKEIFQLLRFKIQNKMQKNR